MKARPLALFRRACPALALATGFLACGSVNAAPGTLDPSFGTGGIAGDDRFRNVTAMAVLSSGKILVAAHQSGGSMALLRFNPDGTADASFGSGGMAELGNAMLYPRGMAVLADGRILVSGVSHRFVSDGLPRGPNIYRVDFLAVARFTGDGILDQTFGTGGIAGGSNSTGNSPVRLAVLSNGRILLMGQAQSSYATQLNLFEADGTWNSDFGSFMQGPDKNDGALEALPDGTFLTAGAGTSAEHPDGGAMIARWNADGAPDPSFGSGGKVVFKFRGGTPASVTCVSVQSDGKILAGGQSGAHPNVEFVIARFNSNGAFDTSFSGDGRAIVIPGRFAASEIAALSDGRIIAAGQAGKGVFSAAGNVDEYNFTVVRCLPDGSLDNQFGQGGKVRTNLAGTSVYNIANCVASQPDGRILAAGQSAYKMMLVRYEGSSAPQGLAAWRQHHFGTEENSGVAANLSDFDHDGLVNLVEYAFALNPRLPTSAQMPAAVWNGSSLTISFPQLDSVQGIAFGAEWSRTMLPGTWTPVPDTGSGGMHVFSVPVPEPGATEKFLRLTVTPQ